MRLTCDAALMTGTKLARGDSSGFPYSIRGLCFRTVADICSANAIADFVAVDI